MAGTLLVGVALYALLAPSPTWFPIEDFVRAPREPDLEVEVVSRRGPGPAALVHEVRTAERDAGPPPAVLALPLPADDLAVTRFAARLADALALRKGGRPPVWLASRVRVEDRATAERVVDALAARGWPVREAPVASAR
ncbi:MAG: hypothetical protein U1E39_07945 [Planctomycetota bacterium]